MDIELAQTLAENKLLKSLLYCTKRSCNNCGKVNCENFQRQRIDCCGNWVSYKDYIADLEKENAELKETVIKMNNVITETFSNLTKAKEIIRDLLNLPFASNEEVFADVGSYLYEAELFLSEVEK